MTLNKKDKEINIYNINIYMKHNNPLYKDYTGYILCGMSCFTCAVT